MRKWNKLLALLLAMVMVFGLTATAFAAENEGDEAETPAETETTETTEDEKTNEDAVDEMVNEIFNNEDEKAEDAEPAEGEDAAEPTEGEEAAEPTEGEDAAEPAEDPYADVDSWAKEHVKAVVEIGLIEMTEATGFQPKAAMTRGDMVLALYRLADRPEVAEDVENPFTDIADSDLSDEAKAAVVWAYSLGIVSGETETIFNPNGAIERQGIAKVLYVFAGDKAAEVEEDQLAAFSDKDDVADWAVSYLNWLVSTKLMTGSDGKLLPMDTITRQEVATILNRYVTNILNAEAAEPTEGEDAAEPAEGAEDESPAANEDPGEVEVPEGETEPAEGETEPAEGDAE